MTNGRLREAVTKLRLDRRLPVYVKQSYRPFWPASWENDDLPNRYAAPVTAFTVDRGGFELWAEKGRLRLEPEPYGTRIRHQRSTAVPTIQYDPFRREVTVAGVLPKDRKRLDTLSVPRPDEAAASYLGRRFVPTEKVPESVPTAILEGNTIAEAVAACLPPSDNNVAENLFLMAAQHQEPLGDKPYSVARRQMTEFLTKTVGIAPGDLNVFDGSGMSRHNLVTTRAITQLLVWASREPTAPIWRASMARPGLGTLRERLTGIEFDGKTGTLNMVVGLSGYVKAKSGKDVVVSILLNHFPGASKDARDAADQVVRNVSEAF
jgi:D-alanyl-D-alanine carboxypeptidase/D-alanyl-D-alanine-endopeptidase (penicillin-binding protein 4)